MGYHVVIVDALVYKQPHDFPWTTFVQGRIEEPGVLESVFSTYKVEAVMHFAASIEVGLSVKDPLLFYENNVVATLRLLKTMMRYSVKKIIFSSSCAVYGVPEHVPIDETCPRAPISPYGKTKMIIEDCLYDFHQAYDLSFIALRYFNAAGLWPGYGLGEYHNPETHLIPLILRAIQSNEPFCMYGNDYPTPDGTCIRDYLHVWDIAQAHWRALMFLEQHDVCADIFNIGTGKGHSVLEVIRAVEARLQKQLSFYYGPRREGDPATLVADATRIQHQLQWRPFYSDLTKIIETV